MRTLKIFAILLISATVAACATQEGHRSVQRDYSLTQNFVPMVASSDQYEINSSKLALKKSHNEMVRKIAKRMIADHTASSRKLAALLKNEGMPPVPSSMMHHHQRSLEILQSASDFDDQYLETQDVAHHQAIDMFQTYSQRGDNSDLRDFAARTLPTLYKHRDMIEKARNGAQQRMPAGSTEYPE